jgi:hypothetical protein
MTDGPTDGPADAPTAVPADVPAEVPARTLDLHGVSVLACAARGPALRGDDDALDVVAEALGAGVDMVAVPVERLPDEFFSLRTRLAGGVVQKFVNYRLRLSVVGDISRHVAASAALRDFVTESNRGRQLWFVSSLDELAERLRGAPRAG